MAFNQIRDLMSSSDGETWIDVRILAMMYDKTVEEIVKTLQCGLVRWERDDFGGLYVGGQSWVALFGEAQYHRRN